MKKGLSRWVTAIIIIILTLAIIAAMYIIGTGTIVKFARAIFSQS